MTAAAQLLDAVVPIVRTRLPRGVDVDYLDHFATGPALLLLSCAVAFAQDGGAGPSVAAPSSMPSADLLLSMGPYGALVWGAYLLGKGVKVTVQIELSERDREILERMGKGGNVVASHKRRDEAIEAV